MIVRDSEGHLREICRVCGKGPEAHSYRMYCYPFDTEKPIPLLDVEIELYAEHMGTMEVFHRAADRDFSYEDAAKILMLKRRLWMPRWLRKIVEWWER